MKFFKKRNKTLKYIERLALENVENKKKITELEKTVNELLERNKLILGQVKVFEEELDKCGNINERLDSLENDMVRRDTVRDIISDVVPLGDIDDMIYEWEHYDFDEFCTRSDIDDAIDDYNFITEDDIREKIDDYISDIKDDIVSDLMQEVKEIETPKWDDPEQFMLFLNKLAKYVVTQTNNNN